MKKYWLHPKIKWKTYKELHDKTAVPDSGPTPKNFEKNLWQMLRKRMVNIYIMNKVDGDTWYPTLKPIPKRATLIFTPQVKEYESN